MFVIELDPEKHKRSLGISIKKQLGSIDKLTDFELKVFASFCKKVGRLEEYATVVGCLNNRKDGDDTPYEGDPEVMKTRGSLWHGTGGGKRNIRGSDPMS